MYYIFTFLAAVLNIYYILCFINIILSWIPGLKFTKFGRFIYSITDPYLHLFSKSGKFTIGYLDFSPVISIGLLVLVSTIISQIASSGVLNVSNILITILYSVWNITATFLVIFFVLVLVRWIVLLVNHGVTSYDSAWNNVDAVLRNLTNKISRIFSKNSMSYLKSLLITWIVLLATYILLFILIGFIRVRGGVIPAGILVKLCTLIPT